MATQIYRVDLSDKARDFQATATEPGLPMLDRQGSNFEILQQWFGTLIAEPEWRGTELVNFYVNEGEGGRLEDIYVYPCTKKDLDSSLTEQFDDLESRLKRAKPQTSNEELLLRIAREQYKTLTADLDHSDFDCHFFKYRLPGSPWKIVWCWGYQRTDLQPCPPLICHNGDCNILFVRRPDTKNRCPRCNAVVDGKRRRGVLGTLRRNGWMIALALLLLFLLLGWFGWPRIVVEPGDWAGPPGSRAHFKIFEKKWFFFKKDITDETQPQSSDTRVIEFDRYGCTARAGVIGRANLTFIHNDRAKRVAATVIPANPPDSLEILIDPDKNVLAVGSTAKLTVWGKYDDGSSDVDFTEVVTWDNSDDQIVARYGARVEGVDVGEATLTATIGGKNDKDVSADAEFTVKKVNFVELLVSVDPNEIPVGGSGEMTIDSLDDEGEKWCMLGSSLLQGTPPYIDPTAAARVDGDFVAGLEKTKPDGATLTVTVSKKEGGPIVGSCTFTVTDGLLAGLNGPSEVTIRKYEELTVDIASPSILPFEGESADPGIAAAMTGDYAVIVGRNVGKTDVTFTQGEETISIGVTVVDANLTGLRIEPREFNLSVSEAQMVRVVATTEAGAEFDIATDVLEWVTQPRPQYVEFNRDLMEVLGRQETPAPEMLAVQLAGDGGSLADLVNVNVVGNPLAAELEFGAYGPVAAPGLGTGVDMGPYGNGTLVPGGIRVGDGFPGVAAGGVINEWGGVPLAGMTPAGMRDHVLGHPLVGDDVVGFIGPGGVLGSSTIPPNAFDIAAAQMGAVVTDTQTAGSGASVTVRVSRAAEYRIVDGSGQPLSSYVSIPENGQATISISNVPRPAGAAKIELSIERNMGGDVKLIPFDLEVGGGASGGIPGVLPLP